MIYVPHSHVQILRAVDPIWHSDFWILALLSLVGLTGPRLQPGFENFLKILIVFDPMIEEDMVVQLVRLQIMNKRED